MSRSPFATAAAAVLITLAGGAIGLGTAQAKIIYTGTFDPEGPDYAWSGTHKFSVDESCLSSDGWKAVNGNTFFDSSSTLVTSCGAVELTGGTLTLKHVSSGSQQTLDFTDALTTPLTTGIWGIYVADGKLAGVDTDMLGPMTFSTTPLNAFDWVLRWESGKAPDAAFDVRSQENPPFTYNYTQSPDDPVYLSFCNGSTCSPATPEPARLVTFTAGGTVPEPLSLALVGSALAALGLTRRRRG